MKIQLKNRKKIVVKGNKKPCLIVCHGDSVTEYTNGYIGHIKLAAQAAAPVDATIVNEGHANQDMNYLVANVQTQIINRNPDIATLCVLLNEGGGDPSANIRTWVNAVLAHTNPNGKKPIILLATDNFCGQNLGTGYPRSVADLDACHTFLINVYTALAAENPGSVFFCDPYATFRALGVDTPQLYSVLDNARVHPNIEGGKLMINAMQQGIFQAVFKFYNN